MSLTINKDGKQLGPYTLEEARAMVLAGKIDADDWAWPDGATEWVQLKDVPGFAAAKPAGPPARPATAPTSAAVTSATAVSAAEEEELWHGHPSQILNLHVYVFWGAILIVALFVASFGDTWLWKLVIFGLVALVALGQSAWAYFHLHMVEYIVTTQRVRVISGLFSKEVQEIELFRVKDTAVRQSFVLRLFGLGTITVLSGDEGHPRLVLDGVPRALELRERLRQEVMSLRQRFGVRELDVM